MQSSLGQSSRRNRFLKIGILVLLPTVLLVAFQNCGQFSTREDKSQISEALTAKDVMHLDVASLTDVAIGKQFIVSADTAKFKSGSSFTWTHSLDGAADACTQYASADASSVTLTCPAAGVIKVTFKATDDWNNVQIFNLSFKVYPGYDASPSP